MTTDEAKDYIREWCPYVKQDEIIKALSNSDEDCISREAVLSLKTPVDTMTGWSGYMIDALDVEQLQSIQPKPKTDVLDKTRAEITTLQNRCYSLTKGTMCAFCKFECEYKEESEE